MQSSHQNSPAQKLGKNKEFESATEQGQENAAASVMKASTSASVVCHEHISRLPPPMKL
jgi:hypothetical protein